MTINVEDLALV